MEQINNNYNYNNNDNDKIGVLYYLVDGKKIYEGTEKYEEIEKLRKGIVLEKKNTVISASKKELDLLKSNETKSYFNIDGVKYYEGTKVYEEYKRYTDAIETNNLDLLDEDSIQKDENIINNEDVLTQNNKEKINDNFFIENNFTKKYINLDIIPPKGSSINELNTLKKYFGGDEKKLKTFILNIQKIILRDGKMQEEDILHFGNTTARYVYLYYPEIFLNSDILSVRDRAKNIIDLNKNINFIKTISEFNSILEGYKKYPSITSKGRPAYIYNREIKNYRILNSGEEIYGDKATKAYLGATSLKGFNTPKKGTAISNKLDYELNGVKKSNNIYIFKDKNTGKIALQFYLGGELRVSTFVSPGKGKKGKGYSNTPIGVFENIGGTDTYHVSFAKAKNNITKKEGKYFGWSMPLSIRIDGPIFLHSGYVTGHPESHGCIRVPPFYMTILAKYLGNKGVKADVKVMNSVYN